MMGVADNNSLKAMVKKLPTKKEVNTLSSKIEDVSNTQLRRASFVDFDTVMNQNK